MFAWSMASKKPSVSGTRSGRSYRRSSGSRSVQSSMPLGFGTTFRMLTDWIELCELLSAQGAEYLVIGGQAVIAHGYPRLTKDMPTFS